MMAGIKGGNTKPERDLRTALHARGFRYRLHAKNIVGRPDLVFPKYNAVVFVHGCFWHRHEGCRYATTPATRQDFWQKKFGTNVARDELVLTSLLNANWRVATVWECALKMPAQVSIIADQIALWLISEAVTIELRA
jgi:DNA mismatch endonuclease (patch repair protein)